MIPETNNTWVAELQRRYPTGYCNDAEYFDLLARRPIIAWFSNKKKAIHRLYKTSGRNGDDTWIISGTDEETNERLFVISPRPLLICLRYPTVENGWVLCEFENQLALYEAVINYLKS